MPSFDAKLTRVNAFEIGEEFCFKRYFERTELFRELETYYDRDEYRFEIPADDFDDVRDRLREEGIELVTVDDLEPYCVVKEQYTKYADILRNAVAHWQRREHNFFLLTDQLAVEAAIRRGATPLSETDFALGL